MNPCPKCAIGTMHGPTYGRGPGEEWLLYRCGTCGYSEKRPTADADAARAVLRKLEASNADAVRRLEVAARGER